MLQRAASNAYSWWWASHIRTKQSKWLEQNLQDFEEKVGNALKLIEEEGDSFAKRAQMYYNNRPELIIFVQESFRTYRALAERYDHLSTELQKANTTIATVFPEQIQFAMDEEDEYNALKNSKKLPQMGNLNAPKAPAGPVKDLKSMFSNATKKSKLPKTSGSSISKVQKSGLSKPEGLEKMDKLQKEILVMQTEKEFLKISYEHGYKKFREIEKQIVEMQQEVFKLQDEFGDGTFIEDEEARTLMATSALKSCQEALTVLQKKQDKVAKEAATAHNKIEAAQEKFEPLRDEYLPERERSSPGVDKLPRPLKSKEVKKELETMCEEIKDHFEAGEGSCLSVTELADRIDELVNKVIGLETDISGETALVQRLKTETDELQAQIQGLEDEKPNQAKGSKNLIKKLKETDARMQIIQEIDRKVTDQNQKLETSFTQSWCNLAHLSQKMSNVKPDEELDAIAEVPAVREKRSKKSKKEKGERKSKKKKEKESEIITDSSRTKEQERSREEAKEQVEGKSRNSKKDKEVEVEVEERVESQDQKHEISGASPLLEAAGDNSNAAEDPPAEVSEKREEQTPPPGEVPPAEVPEKQEQTAPAEKERALDTSQEKANDTPPEKAHDSLPEKANDTPPVKAPDTPPKKAHDSPPEKANDTQPEKAHDTPPAAAEKALDKLPEKANNTPPEKAPDGDQEKSLPILLKEDGDSFPEKAPAGQVEQDIFLDIEPPETEDEDLEEPNWHDMFKDVQKRLQEVEKKSEDGLFDTSIHIRGLKSANAKKDEEIRSLRKKLKHLQAKLESMKDKTDTDTNTKPESSSIVAEQDEDEEDIYDMKFLLQNMSHEISETEMKFRGDIDELLEENLDFWLRFSASFHQIQKFENEVQDLKADAVKIIKEKKGEGSNTRRTSLKAEARSIYKHLSEINTELNLWLETSANLKEELQSRFSSICCIQEEITKALKDSAEDEDFKFTSFIAAKFQGEILNMKQENNKVADELQAGSDHVSGIQAQVEKSLTKLDDEFGFTGARNASRQLQHSESRNRVPLRSFIFGGKQKKQNKSAASIFSSVSPALSRKYNIIKQGVQI